MKPTAAAWLCAALASTGCRDDFNQSDAGTDETDGESDSESGDGDGDNLLVNGSFEMWAGSTPVAWTTGGGVTLSEHPTEPWDGDLAAELAAAEYNEVRQSISLAEPLPADTVIAAEFAYRWIEGDFSAPGIDLRGVRPNDEVFLLPPITPQDFAGEQWTVGGGNIMLPEPIVGIQFVIVSGGFAPQTVQVDAARLWLP